MSERMTLEEAWPTIRALGRKTMPAVIASTNADGSPQVTPIGSLRLLRSAGHASYLERFPTRLRENLDRDPRLSLLLLDLSFGLWLGGIWRGRFQRPVGVRLTGRAGPRRAASTDEVAWWLRRVRPFRGTRGHRLLWSGMSEIRDIELDTYAPIHLGAMSAPHWRRVDAVPTRVGAVSV